MFQIRMRKILLFVVILVVLKSVIAFKDEINGECGQEFMRIFQSAQACNSGNGYNIFKIDETLAKVENREISRKQLKKFIKNTCRTALNDTACIRNIQASDTCKNSQIVKLVLNMHTIIETQVNYLCSAAPGSNRVRYLELIQRDGPVCMAANHELKACMKMATDQMGLADVTDVLKADMCALIKTHEDCAHHYDSCKNKQVKRYMTDVLNLLNEKYTCSAL